MAGVACEDYPRMRIKCNCYGISILPGGLQGHPVEKHPVSEMNTVKDAHGDHGIFERDSRIAFMYLHDLN
jgi:hypothetical protein